jgi:hypothetical protein
MKLLDLGNGIELNLETGETRETKPYVEKAKREPSKPYVMSRESFDLLARQAKKREGFFVIM